MATETANQREVLVDARQSLGPARLADLFPEGAAFRGSLKTFSVLLGLASFIASFGLYQDSVASIIGAMVVAPLGGAIMAFAGALVTARTRWHWPVIVASELRRRLSDAMVAESIGTAKWDTPMPIATQAAGSASGG